ncbi:hypothetical protein EG329_002468 [Mollisiaceae sp. DMI_Dod_QoI]|nr:hypothetical protein EG329_002468 [Helotiales sp. DMI_Dod_QoI]
MSSYNLDIQLDSPYQRGSFRQHLFVPGDHVSGKVVFNLKEDIKIERIFLEFKGKCRVRDDRGEDERTHNLIMFTMTRELFQGPFKMRAAVYEYPFSFQFPEQFDFKSTEFHENELYEARLGLMPLPPSVEAPWGGPSNELCSICYYLKVKIPRTFGNWEDKVPLNFMPFRTKLSPDPLLRTSKDFATFYRNYRLSLEGTPRPLTKGETVKHAFHRHSSTQTIRFSLSAEAPTAIVLGRPYSIEVTVIPTIADVWENSPEFRLKHYTLSLKATTSVRVPCKSTESTRRQKSIIQINSGFIDVPVVSNKTIKLNGMFSMKANSTPPPTFTSFSARRVYELELRMKVSCLNEESKFKINWPDVTVYSSRMESGIEDAMRAIEDGTMVLGLDDQGGLPSYSGGTEIGGSAEEALPEYQR